MSADESHSTGQGNFVSQVESLSPIQIPFRPTGTYPSWQPRSSTQFQQHHIYPQFTYNQPYQNMPYYHQPIQPPPYSFFQQATQSPQLSNSQPFSNSQAPHHNVPPTRSDTNQRNNKNWSKEEDLQLTNAWIKISTDACTGVSQKRARLWERVVDEFVKLMHEKHEKKPEDNVRTPGGCENRMSEIKAQCSRWTASRTRAYGQNHSGWSTVDVEKLCHTLHEAEGKGPFKWQDCWDVLKEHHKWVDYCNKKTGNNSCSKRVRTQETFSNAPVNESAPIDSTSDNVQTETTSSPIFENTRSESQAGGRSGGTCTPNLEGPASIDLDRPPGMKKAKNQRQRKIRQHSESQTSVSKSLTANMMSIESATSSRWEKIEDANKKRDLKDEERYNDMRRMQALEHEMKVGKDRGELILQREIIGDKLVAAIHKLDQIDPLSIVTSNQMMIYDIKKKAVEDFQEQHEVLGKLLSKTKNYNSPGSAPSKDNIAIVGSSQRRLFGEDVVCLDHD